MQFPPVLEQKRMENKDFSVQLNVHSSFPVKHKVANVGNLVRVQMEINWK